VRIYRDLLGHPSLRNDAEAMAFAWMVIRAQWKPARVRYKGHAFNLERGQLAISQRDMAEALDRDKSWVERLWKRCKAEAMISVTYEAGAAVVTICNYAEYQAGAADCEAVNENGREAPNEAGARQAQGTEQVKEELNTSEPKGSSVVVERAPKPFALPAGMGIDPQHWNDLLANRKRKRLANTPTAYEGQLRAIAQLSDDEWPPGRLVQFAAERGWGAIFDPRSSGGPNGQRASNDRPSGPINPMVAAGIAREARFAGRDAAPG
jgi:hypothetical protein